MESICSFKTTLKWRESCCLVYERTSSCIEGGAGQPGLISIECASVITVRGRVDVGRWREWYGTASANASSPLSTREAIS